MKLNSCTISGFGKIHDRQFDFDKGLNVFCEENGYGKSTIASFIKVMFYGFEDENKRSLKDKEREKFRPWIKGVYGGSISFEYEGKNYEVSRTFGKNESEDSFEVRELPSNTLTDIFNKDILGNTIFGIDKDSFFRTAYIASPDLNKSKENVTDSIRAKLGNLTDATDDINNFESAVSRIEKKMNEFSPDRKPGKIKCLQAEIAEDMNRYRNLPDVEKATEILENQIQAQNERIENDRNKIKKLKESEKEVMQTESYKAKRKMYDSLKNEYELSRKKTDEIFDFFSGHVPSLSEINSVRDRGIKMKRLKSIMEADKPDQSDKLETLSERFKNGICSENEIKNYISLWNEMQGKKRNLDEKENQLYKDAEEYIRSKTEENRDNYERGLKNFKEREKKRKTKLAIFLVLALLFFGAAVALTVMGILGMRSDYILLPEVAAFIIGLIFLILIFALRLFKKNDFSLSEDMRISKEEAISRVDSSHFVRNVIKSGRDEISFTNNQVKNFLEKYKVEFNEEKTVDDLLKLLDDAKEYENGRAKYEEYEKTKAEYIENENEVNAFFEQIGQKPDEEDETQLDDYQKMAIKFVQYMEESERKKKILMQFEDENDITEICRDFPDEMPDIDDIRDEIEELEEEVDKEIAMLSNFRNRLEERQSERDALNTLGEKINDDKERLAQYEKDYALMETALMFLNRAKSELSLKYTGPTMEGFRKFSAYFEEEDADSFRIDTDLNLTKTEEGMQRRISDLSLGIKEVTDFCLRLALIEAMYEKEKPFIVLDDPFVNYDENNLSGAKKVLDAVSKDYQVLYFTCHESRIC